MTTALQQVYDNLIAEAKAILAKFPEDIPEEKLAEAQGLMGKADQIRARMQLEGQVEDADGQLIQRQGDRAKSLQASWREAAPGEGEVDHDPKSWREIEVPGVFGRKVRVRYNVPLVVQEEGYKDVWEAHMRVGRDRMSTDDLKTLSVGIDSAGGHFVPEDFHAEIIKKVATIAVFRQFARMVTTSRDSAKFPRVKYTTDDKWTTGARVTWTGEVPTSSTVHRVTDPVLGIVDVPVHNVMASIPLTHDLIEDSAFDVLGFAGEILGEAFGLGEESAFWVGSGSGQPLGLLDNVDETDGIVSVASGSATVLQSDELIELFYTLPAQYESGARAFWNKSTELALRQLKNSTTDEYAWPVEERVGAFGVPEPTILGFPFTRAEFVPDIAGDAYPIVFGDLKGYYVIDRVGLSVQRLVEVYAEQNLIVLLARKRVGGQVVEPWKLKCQKIST
jgi:HK97 family phage major capsid protein